MQNNLISQNTNYPSYMSMRDPNSWDIPDPPAVVGSNRIYAVSFVGQFDERPGYSGYQERECLFSHHQNIIN